MLELGMKVKDRLSEFTGTVTGRTEYLYGCKQILITPGEIKDGKPVDSAWFDEDRFEPVITPPVKPPESATVRRGGPAQNPPSREGKQHYA